MRLLLALLLLPLLSIHAAELPPAATQTLLKKLQEHRANAPCFTADFIEEKTTHLLTRPLTTTGTILFLVPNKFRREVTGKSPSLTVSNGQRLWIYYPSFQEAELYTLGQKAFFDDSIAALTAGLNFQNIEKFFTCKAESDGERYRIHLTPRSSGLRRMVKALTVYVDSGNEIQRTETTLPKGDRVITTYKNLRPAALPASTFDFHPPAEVHITQPLGK